MSNVMKAHSDSLDASMQLRCTKDGSLFTSNFLLEVNKGNIVGHSLVHKFGRNDNAGTAVEDIQYGGGTTVPLTAAVTMEAISANANDDAAGTKARTVQIWGVDGNFNAVTEVIDMNGTSASTATTQTFLRVFKARVISCGTYNVANEGNITIRVNTAGATQLIIEADSGVSQTAHYTVPANHIAYIVSAHLSIDTSKSSRFILSDRGNTNLLVAPFDPHKHVHTWDGVTGPIPADFISNHEFAEKTDIWFESVAGAINTPLEVDYDILVIDTTLV